jgi:hypothetical protein
MPWYEMSSAVFLKRTRGIAGMCRRFPLCGLAQEKQLLVFSSCFGSLFRIFRVPGFHPRPVGRLPVRLAVPLLLASACWAAASSSSLAIAASWDAIFWSMSSCQSFIRSQFVSVFEKSDGGFQVVDGSFTGGYIGLVE